jgi:ATP-dependent DNA ligase
MLARQVEQIPAEACPSGCRYEPKWDGFRNAAELHSTRHFSCISEFLYVVAWRLLA